MTSLPGPTQPRPPAPSAAGDSATDPHTIPESVRYLVTTWRIIVALEILHQLLNVALVIADPSALRAAAKEALGSNGGPGIEAPQAMLDLAVYGSAVFSALVGIAIQAGLLVATFLISRRKRAAGGARRLLLFFGIYLVIRGLAVFTLGYGGTAAPVALVAGDGALQLLSGVAAAAALVFGGRQETLQWTERRDATTRRAG